MGQLADQMRQLEVSVTHPDESVTLHLDGAGRVRVELAKGCLARNNEATLARKVDQVVRIMLATWQRAVITTMRSRQADWERRS